MNEPVTTIVGNLIADPELRYTPNGAAVANFRVASTPRTFDRQANQWVDGDALFMPCSIWREAAENVSETLTKGMRVIVTGRLKSRSYETKEGDKRTVIEMEVEEVGPALRYATAKVNRTQRDNNGGGQRGGGNSQRNYDAAQQGNGWNTSPSSDPWATGGSNTGNQQQSQGSGWNTGQGLEPPF